MIAGLSGQRREAWVGDAFVVEGQLVRRWDRLGWRRHFLVGLESVFDFLFEVIYVLVITLTVRWVWRNRRRTWRQAYVRWRLRPFRYGTAFKHFSQMTGHYRLRHKWLRFQINIIDVHLFVGRCGWVWQWWRTRFRNVVHRIHFRISDHWTHCCQTKANEWECQVSYFGQTFMNGWHMVLQIVHHPTAKTISGEEAFDFDQKTNRFWKAFLVSQPVLSESFFFVQIGSIAEFALGVIATILMRLQVLHVFDCHLNYLCLLDPSSALKWRRLQSFKWNNLPNNSSSYLLKIRCGDQTTQICQTVIHSVATSLLYNSVRERVLNIINVTND